MNAERMTDGLAVLACVMWLASCGGQAGEDASADADRPVAASEEASDEAEVGSIDAALADRGGQLFQSRGCNACHTLGGGRLVGPDLAGVTERRDGDFIVAMITSPDSMLAVNETARQMLAEYFTPMPNQGITDEEARALFEYLRRNDAGDGS